MKTFSWQEAVNNCHQQGEGFVLVTVIGTAGSTPREGGSKMVVSSDATFDTIGGGQLEFVATQKAREFLIQGVALQRMEHFPLASKAEQCCGGSVTLMFEVYPCAAINLAVFGAGHVARALVKILEACDTRVDWIDSRADQFPEELPANVHTHTLEEPEQFVAQVRDNTRVLILTHDHALDYRLLAALLDDTEVGYIGLIGSDTKAKRFHTRLKHDGFRDEHFARYQCPVGLPEFNGKRPMEVAVSIAAKVLSLEPAADDSSHRGVSWREIKQALNGMDARPLESLNNAGDKSRS
jgi:xanthine dehydrogenase accessory factor